MKKAPLLSVRNLSVRFPLKGRDEHGKRKTLLPLMMLVLISQRGKHLALLAIWFWKNLRRLLWQVS